MTELASAPLPPLAPDDHVRGPAGAPLAFLYFDYECAYCAVAVARVAGAALRVAFRHFPVRSKHPRAWAAAAAAEAAGEQGCFWGMHDSLFAGQARLEDPQLWERARELGLDVEAFDVARRSETVTARVRRDFEGGLRAGVATTPTLFAGGVAHPGIPDAGLVARLEGGWGGSGPGPAATEVE